MTRRLGPARLDLHGFSPGNVDGIWGPLRTRPTVRAEGLPHLTAGETVPPNPTVSSTRSRRLLASTPRIPSFDLDVTHVHQHRFRIPQSTQRRVGHGFRHPGQHHTLVAVHREPAALNLVKSYIFLYVKLIFDPPDSRFALPAFQKQLKQLTWSINVAAEIVNPPTDPFGNNCRASSTRVMKTYISPAVVQLSFASTVTI